MAVSFGGDAAKGELTERLKIAQSKTLADVRFGDLRDFLKGELSAVSEALNG